jgi:hypothetical protein
MGSRRFVLVGAVATAAVLAGMANASAAPSSDTTSDRRAVEVGAHLPAARAAVDPIESEFVPVSPVRVLDTRTTGAPVPQGGTVTVDLTSRTPANATAVVLNVTGTQPTGGTFITVYPAGEARPDASNLNLVPGQTRANAVTVGLDSADRRISLYNNFGNTHLIADLAGYYIDGAASRYNAVQPGRVLDTRGSGPVGPGGTVAVSFPWLPDSATAVTLNVTGVSATTNTFVTAFPNGQSAPLASNLNLGPNETVPNQVTVPLGANKTVRLLNGNGFVHLIADEVGYYQNGVGDRFVPLSPVRAMDTREFHDGLTPDIFIALTGWPSDVTGVVGNLTGTNPEAAGYVVVWPGGQPVPNTSNLNLVPGQTAPNLVTVGIGFESHPDIQDRSINFANSAGYVDVIFDVAGFFVPVTA